MFRLPSPHPEKRADLMERKIPVEPREPDAEWTREDIGIIRKLESRDAAVADAGMQKNIPRNARHAPKRKHDLLKIRVKHTNLRKKPRPLYLRLPGKRNP
jgi:hypothetical protein